MKNNILIKLLVIEVILFGFHFLISNFLIPAYAIDELYKMHLFLGITTLIIIYLIQLITKIDAENFGKGFMVSVVLKMLASVIFLWPTITSTAENKKLYIVHFFLLFFIYLFIEVKLLISSLKK